MKNDWKNIRNYYVHNEVTQADCAKKFKVSLRTVQTHCAKEKWAAIREQKREEIARKSDLKLTERAIDRKIAANEKHNELYDKGLEVAELLLDLYLQEIKSGKKLKKANAYNLDFIMKAITNAQKGQRQALNIEDKDVENVEPEVHIINGIDLEQI